MGENSKNTAPRIYVACLSAYNSGYLHGAWIDADQDQEAVAAEIEAMLARSPVVGAEEYAIHDYEGFEGARIEEYADLSTVVELAAFATEHGALGGAVLEHFGGDLAEARGALEERYHGCFASLADFMQDLTEETSEIPENLRRYIDWSAMARDAELNGDVVTVETGFEVVHVFWGR